MPDPGPGAEAIQAGILRMCHQLAAVQALLQQDPGNAAAATLSEGIAAAQGADVVVHTPCVLCVSWVLIPNIRDF